MALDRPWAWIRRNGLALLVTLAAAILYALTLCPTVSWYDSAEFSASAATLRVVPHPPGYPLYTLVGHAFTWLPGEAALGLNIMSLVFGALSIGLLFIVARRIGQRPIVAATVALGLAVAPTMWGNAVKAEVYTPGVAWLLAVVWLCLEAVKRQDMRWAWGAAWLAGTGLGMHMSIATFGLGFAVLLGHGFWDHGQPRNAMVRRFATHLGLGCVVAAVVGGLVFLLIPFGPFDVVTPLGPYPATFERMWIRFVADLGGGIFRRYFKPLPTAERLERIGDIFVLNVGGFPLLMASVGLLVSLVRQRVLAIALLLGALGNVAFFFRYDVPDLDVFLLPALVATWLFVGLGIESAARVHLRAPTVLASLVAIVFTLSARDTYTQVDLSDDRSARNYAESACEVLQPGDVLAMTSMPSEWHLSSVLLYMHEAKQGCLDVEFWGMANVDMIREALRKERRVFAYVEQPRFADAFRVTPKGPLFRITQRNAPSGRRVNP